MRSDRTSPRPAPAPGPASAVPGQVVLCLGCAYALTGQPHQCGRELLPYGGWCDCPQPGCGTTAYPPQAS